MQVKAKARFIRMSARKVRLVIDLIRGKHVDQALAQLQFTNRAAAMPVVKLLKSAIANAQHNFKLEPNSLMIKEITADEGPTLDRWMPRAHGRAMPIRKRTSHISITLDSSFVEMVENESEKNTGKKEKKSLVRKITKTSKSNK